MQNNTNSENQKKTNDNEVDHRRDNGATEKNIMQENIKSKFDEFKVKRAETELGKAELEREKRLKEKYPDLGILEAAQKEQKEYEDELQQKKAPKKQQEIQKRENDDNKFYDLTPYYDKNGKFDNSKYHDSLIGKYQKNEQVVHPLEAMKYEAALIERDEKIEEQKKRDENEKIEEQKKLQQKTKDIKPKIGFFTKIGKFFKSIKAIFTPKKNHSEKTQETQNNIQNNVLSEKTHTKIQNNVQSKSQILYPKLDFKWSSFSLAPIEKYEAAQDELKERRRNMMLAAAHDEQRNNVTYNNNVIHNIEESNGFKQAEQAINIVITKGKGQQLEGRQLEGQQGKDRLSNVEQSKLRTDINSSTFTSRTNSIVSQESSRGFIR